MLAHVKTHTASFWAESFVKVLEKSIAASEQSSYTPLLEIDPLLNKYSESKKRLLCFDYDVNIYLFVKKRKIIIIIELTYNLTFRVHCLKFENFQDLVHLHPL